MKIQILTKNKFFFSSFFFLLFSLFTSCKEETIIIPDYILSQDTMAAVLVDIQLLEAMKVKMGVNDSLSRDSILIQYARIFKRHHITQEQFENSFDFYKSHPRLLEEIFDETINELSRMQATLGKANKATADSVKKSRETPGQKPVKAVQNQKGEKGKKNLQKDSANNRKKGKEEKPKEKGK